MALGKVKELVSSNPVVIFRFSLPLHLLVCVYIYRIVDRFEPIWKFDNEILFRSNKFCPYCVCVKQLFVLKLGVQYKAIELDQESQYPLFSFQIRILIILIYLYTVYLYMYLLIYV